MDEELIVDPRFQKGFNDGYILAEHEPDLAKDIVANKNDHNTYFSGLVSGKQEYDLEKAMQRIHGMNRNETQHKDLSQDKGKTRD